jgi:hypothetical protein
MSGNVVDNIDDMNPGVYRQDDSLHYTNVLILKSKIGQQGYDRDVFFHALLDPGYWIIHLRSSIQLLFE